MKHLFFGGVHPRYNKEMSTGSRSFKTVQPKQVVIMMQQHLGIPCQPLVNVGDEVKMGQKIGDGDGMCVPVHASVSGRVVAIEERPHPTQGKGLAVIIENDFQYTAAPEVVPPVDGNAILDAIREAGIVGMGGAAFPSSIKALSAMGSINTLIANACECEPYITADDSLLRTDPEQVLLGMLILDEILQVKRLILAVEDNKAEAIAGLQHLLEQHPKIELRVLPTLYPQGSEKQLVQAVTGRQIPPHQRPSAVGCMVFNVSTFAAIYNAVRVGIPLVRRLVTVSGEAIAQPQNFIVPIGTPIQNLVEAANGLNEKTERIIHGGPMMGTALEDLSAPVIKTTNAVLCLLKDENGAAENPVCLRCGKCVGVCPMRLQPLYMYRFALAGRLDELKRLNINDCMECGCCAFTCPGKLPLVEKFRMGKKMLKEAKDI